MLFVFPSAVYPRRTGERLFKRLYQFCNIVHVVCFVVLMAEFCVRLESSLPGYFTRSRVTLDLGLQTATDHCNYSAEIKIGGISSTLSVNSNSLPVPLMVMAQYVIAILVVQFLAILNSALSLANYSAGVRHLRICGVHVPFYHILCVLSVLYCVVLIVMVFVTRPVRNFYTDAVVACAEQARSRDPALLLQSEYDNYNTFSTPIEWALAAALINLCIYCLAATVLTWRSYSREVVLFSEATVPWEKRGVRCGTNKPALRIHTKARDAILNEAHEALSRGEKVRIACIYALMTEAEYEAQVEEMRQRFSAQMKEEQFEQLRTHFGHASDLEESGLFWRRHTAPPPPPPDDADRLFGAAGFSPANNDTVRIGDGDKFDEILDDPDFEVQFWSEYDTSDYDVADADDGGELAEWPPQPGGAQKHRTQKRRHRHRRDVEGGRVQEEQEEEEEEKVNEKEEEEEEGEEEALSAVPGARRTADDAEAMGREGVEAAQEALQRGPHNHRNRHHRRRRRRSYEAVEREGELDGQLAAPEPPVEPADEL
ncbi:hypothetical protein TraAM80_09102 [Trypanosoma rangeli]|uniref:Uncharacterized protein n=1 Tax=Trypanosoma rangeli TaxID=5698 RepID=A0A422MXB0_TRYRA|nr:uncharacterized protein TraAM80_09102 [Trypanosoma rangeli]RNE97847.1 hypothetical protein TraAM80_09102 [Trypanosoma rangeli]|eukprot:RNE97847.1 hypothetical protein TraAM80_09102 [Trypanosoma rangeli]